ncbi:hypothetical protein AX15_005529 [Amanita polypyramis BW_CC]|nr:hypothetical protein AX15_005529 [Amanita polypyramis BW_CC]
MPDNIPSGVYHITNAKATETAIDLSGTDQESIVGWPSHDGDNQKWLIEDKGGRYTIKNLRFGKYIGLRERQRDGVRAYGLINDEFLWEIKRDDQDPTVHRFFVPGTPFNLDLTDHGNAQGNTPIAVWGKWEGRNQCWRLRLITV